MKISNVIFLEDAPANKIEVEPVESETGTRYNYYYFDDAGQKNQIPYDHPFYQIKRDKREKLIDPKKGVTKTFKVNGVNTDDGVAQYDLKLNTFTYMTMPSNMQSLEGEAVTGLTLRQIWNQLGVGIGGTTKTRDLKIDKGKKGLRIFGKDGSFQRFMRGDDENPLARDTRRDPTASNLQKLFVYGGLKAMGFGPGGSRQPGMREIPLSPEVKKRLDVHIKNGHGEFITKYLRDVQLALQDAEREAKRQRQMGPVKSESKQYTATVLENDEPEIPIGSILNRNVIAKKGPLKGTRVNYKYQWNGKNWVNTSLGTKVAKRETQDQLTAEFKKKFNTKKVSDLQIDRDGNLDLEKDDAERIDKLINKSDKEIKKEPKIDPAKRQYDQDNLPPEMPGEETPKDDKKDQMDPLVLKIATQKYKDVLKKVQLPEPDYNDPEAVAKGLGQGVGTASAYNDANTQFIKDLEFIVTKGQLIPAFKYAQEQTAKYFDKNKLGRDTGPEGYRYYNPKYDIKDPADRGLRDPLTSKINGVIRNRQQYIARRLQKYGDDGFGNPKFTDNKDATNFFNQMLNYDEQISALRKLKAQQTQDETDDFKAEQQQRVDYMNALKVIKAENQKLKAKDPNSTLIPAPTYQQFQKMVADAKLKIQKDAANRQLPAPNAQSSGGMPLVVNQPVQWTPKNTKGQYQKGQGKRTGKIVGLPGDVYNDGKKQLRVPPGFVAVRGDGFAPNNPMGQFIIRPSDLQRLNKSGTRTGMTKGSRATQYQPVKK